MVRYQNQCLREHNCLEKCPQMGFQNMPENQTQKASKMASSRASKVDLKCIKFRLKSTLGSLMYPKVTPRCLPSGHQAPRIVKNRLKGYKKDTQHVPNRSKNTTMGPKLAPRSKTSEAQAIKSSSDQRHGPAAGVKPSDPPRCAFTHATTACKTSPHASMSTAPLHATLRSK